MKYYLNVSEQEEHQEVTQQVEHKDVTESKGRRKLKQAQKQ